MYKRRIFGCILLVLVLIFIVTGCKKAESTSVGADIQPTEAAEPTPSVEATPEPTPTASPFVCVLNGGDMPDENSGKLRAIAVMIDNQIQARPQSGLASAEIVYEMPVEGGATRYMAIYHHIDSDKIGPVRSARPYFIDKAMEYKAVYVHCGGSPQALADVVTLKIDALNDLNGDSCFWRAKDRSAPHNLYTSMKLMRDVIASKKKENNPAPQVFKFSDTPVDNNGKQIKGIEFNYLKNYKVSYEFNVRDGLFYRKINGEKLKDKELGTEITAANIVVEIVSVKVLDDVGRLELGNTGKGSGFFITNGKLIEIQWSKDARSSKTVYKDLKGNEIKLNKGNVWVQVVPNYTTIEIKE